MFVGVEGLEEAFVVQPSLHNLKGRISRACGVVGRVLPLEDAWSSFAMLLLWHQGISWRTYLWTVNSTAASSDAAFATAFLLLAGRHGSFQLWWRKTV